MKMPLKTLRQAPSWNQVVRPLLDVGLLEMTIPDKPCSSKQQYRATPAGIQAIQTFRKEPR